MRDSGRLAAAIEILDVFDARRIPLKTALADWGRQNRYAGAKDRAWISGLCLDVLRRRTTLAAWGGAETNRARALACLNHLWKFDAAALGEIAAGEHGIGPLTEEEGARYTNDEHNADVSVVSAFDAPEWVEEPLRRAFQDGAFDELAALSARAPVDLRLNTGAAPAEKTLAAIKTVKAKPHAFLKTAARIDAPDPSARAPAVTVIPAFNKGWVEVQDLGSQIAAAAAGSIAGAQVLDYCAGGGGKTLALAAMMGSTGQIHAYDIDARRLKPLYARAKRAGVRNLQIRSPIDGAAVLDDLIGRMDVVFVDAPCTGSGTWRRHPDAKWRLKPGQLARRQEEQASVLREASHYVKPGGRLVYVTCSVFKEENADQVSAFRRENAGFEAVDGLQQVLTSDLLTPDGEAALKDCILDDGAMQLTPARTGTDGFYVAVLRKVK
ncbi:MAG: RsmB/NOP family class I SAM-dependent RNA methyltransferase [Pseudomonadota bacterium]